MSTRDPDRQFLIRGGRVFKASDSEPWTESLVIVDDRVAAVGPAADLAEQFPRARVVDVEGRTVLPGFIDAHNHFLATGESLASADVRYPGVASLEDLLATIARAAAESTEGEWISAFGYDDAKFEPVLTRWDLDRLSTARPIRVLHVSGHHLFVNSRALDLAGVGNDAEDPPGGRLVRGPDGRLSGHLMDAAMNLVALVAVDIGSHGPNFHTELSLEEAVRHVDRASRAFLAAGLTTVCDAQVTRRELTAYREARRQDRLGVRTVCMPLSHQLADFEAVGLAGPFGDDRLRLGAMKFYADGSLIGGTAWFTEPYGVHGELAGSMYHPPAELEEMIVAAHVAGWQVGVHVQGDRAVSVVLDALEAALRVAPGDHRHRLEHAGYPTRADIERMARLGAITVNQPNYLYDSGDEFISRLGARAHELQPLRDELDAGVHVVLSSDSDVTSYRPLATIRTAIDRRTRSGASIGPTQALTLDEALRAHTLTAAYALQMEDLVGSLEPGKLADLVVVDGDLDGDLDELASRDAWLTMVGGEIVHAEDASLV